MKNTTKNISFLFILLSSLWTLSCQDDSANDPSFTQGEQIDLTTYVAIGNSFTAGYMDGALYNEGQKNSFASVLADRFQKIGGAEKFNIPFVGNELGGIQGIESSFSNRLGFDSEGGISVMEGEGPTTLDNVYDLSNKFHNYGIPGARSFHFVSNQLGNPSGISSGVANPYYVRMASSTNSTVVEDALSADPTFFSMWVGNNDVLGYATAGGDDENPTAVMTSLSDFETSIEKIVSEMTKNGAKGVIANIPDVTSLPFFTRITFEDVVLDADQAQEAKEGYAEYNDGLETANRFGLMSKAEVEKRKVNIEEGANYPVILDNSLTDITFLNEQALSMRQLKEGEMILLSALSSLKEGVGIRTPLPDKYVLDADEVFEIEIFTLEYNRIIEKIADKYDLALFDANALMRDFAENGASYYGVDYSAKFIDQRGNAFSLDGVHPSGQGYAIVANGFIEAINKKYGSSIPLSNPNSYKGVDLP